MDAPKNPDLMSKRELRLEVKALRQAKKRLIREHRKSVQREKDLRAQIDQLVKEADYPHE